jgi:N-ethylmaleimide reductase
MALEHLFTPAKLGELSLPHRVVMAPLTRARAAQPGDIPTELNATYYAQRASASFIIAEATYVHPQGKGYAFTPGIYSEAQIAGWKKVTDAVHDAGGKIFLQIWHVGRVSHSSLQPNGALPVAPSALKVSEGQAFTENGFVDFETPRALEKDEIKAIVETFKQGALNAKKAGFDGVEIHAANGYLLEQFLKDGSNQRTDEYGGSIENRCRLVLEIVEAVTSVLPSDQVGIRISPTGVFNAMSDSNPAPLYEYLVEALNEYDLAYLHVVEKLHGLPMDEFDFKSLRDNFNGAYIANGSYTGESAEALIAKGGADLVSFGSLFISNPDLPKRLETNAELTQPNQDTFYGGGAEGYTDYAFL